MHWRDIWEFLRTWQGMVSAGIAAAAALYYGPRKILETWDWYMDRFHDYVVTDVVKKKRRSYRTTIKAPGSSTAIAEIPYSVKEIAQQTGRTEKSVRDSLRRLERRGKVKEHLYGWAGWDYNDDNDY